MIRQGGMGRTVRQKWNAFRLDPVGSLLSKVASRILQAAQRRAERQLRRRGALDFLAHRPSHSIPPDFADLWFLYRVVRRRRPRYILEFGSGCSTVIMARALWDNQQASPQKTGYLYSIDADPYWAEITTQSMPPHLRGVCEVWCSPVVEVTYQGIPA